MAPRLLVVTPWYPTAERPQWGVFVRDQVAALAEHGTGVTVVHVDPQHHVDEPQVTQEDRPEGTVRHVVIPGDYAAAREEVARLHAAALCEHAADLLTAAEVVHAHVGLPSGAACARMLPPDKRLVVTEHASYAPRALATDGSREEYLAMTHRCAALVTPTHWLGERLRRLLPADLHDRLTVVPNVVRVPDQPSVGGTGRPPRRWLYVGTVLESKGIRRLLRSLAVAREHLPGTTLTVVGAGPDEEVARALAKQLGVDDAITWRGLLHPASLDDVWGQHDVLVHLSHGETFGLTVLEAAAAGLGVVVTRCGGPEETLDWVAELGRVRFVPPGDDPSTVVEAVLDLPAQEPALARRVRALVARQFGAHAVTQRLCAALYPDAPQQDDVETVVVSDLDGAGRHEIGPLARRLVALGVRPVVVNARTPPPASAVPGVLTVDLRAVDRRLASSAPAARVSRRLPSTVRTRWETKHATRYRQRWPQDLVTAALEGDLGSLHRGTRVVVAAGEADRVLARRVGGVAVGTRALDILNAVLALPAGSAEQTQEST